MARPTDAAINDYLRDCKDAGNVVGRSASTTDSVVPQNRQFLQHNVVCVAWVQHKEG